MRRIKIQLMQEKEGCMKNRHIEKYNEELQQKLNNVKVDCVIDIYRSNILPAKITFDLRMHR